MDRRCILDFHLCRDCIVNMKPIWERTLQRKFTELLYSSVISWAVLKAREMNKAPTGSQRQKSDLVMCMSEMIKSADDGQECRVDGMIQYMLSYVERDTKEYVAALASR